MPAQIYTLLLQNLEKAQTKVKAHASQRIKGAAPKKSELNEEDVEWMIIGWFHLLIFDIMAQLLIKKYIQEEKRQI